MSLASMLRGLAPALLLALAACRGTGVDPSAVMVVVIPPPLPDAPPSKADAEAEARADRERQGSSESLVGRYREEFAGRSGCADEIVLTRNGTGLGASSEDCNSKRPYTTRSVKFDGTELRIEFLAPESSYPLRYTLRRTQKGMLEGEVLVGDSDEPSKYKVKWVRER